MKQMVFAALAATLVMFARPSHADAYGAAHVGYTHVGPNGVYHTGATATSGPGGVRVGGQTTAAGYGGAAYHSSSGAAVGYGGSAAYHSSTTATTGYRYAPGYGGSVAGGYGYVR
jgi:hypothetical protein